jgi:hypothetical protein
MPAPKVNELTTPVGQVQLLGLEVLNWRYEELERAGYPTDIAIMLAERGDVDLHDACALLRQGATIHQALSILT